MDEIIIIDIREIIRFLFKRWLWIVLTAFLFVAGTFIYLQQKPTTYSATATVAITRPRSLTNVNNDFATVTDNAQQPYKAYIDLATNNELSEELFNYWNELKGHNGTNLKDFKLRLDAEQGNDTNIIKLNVSLFAPENAVNVANYWAERFVKEINALYYGKNEDQLNYFAEQVSISKQDLDTSNQALIDFNRQNSVSSITNELTSLLDRQNEILGQQRKNKRTVNDILDLINIIKGSDSSTITITDQISTLLLQTSLQSNIPNLQLQLSDLGQLNFTTKTEQINYLNNLLDVMDQNWVVLQTELDALSPQILTLQEQETQLIVQKEALEQDQTLAKETYQSLRIKYEETRINNESDLGGVQIAARATKPIRADSRHLMTYPVIAGMIGGLAAVMIILIIGWWNNAFDFTKKPEEVLEEK